MSAKKEFYQKQATTIINNLEKRNMSGYYCSTSTEAIALAISMMEQGSSISWGGSMTLSDMGMLSALEKEPYVLIDRRTASSPEAVREVYLKAFNADYYLTSANAITIDGELINIDGTGNRVAALIYGPKNVIVVAGMNKVVTDQQSGIERVRNIASPPNTIRIGHTQTPCYSTGICHDCKSPECICCQIVVTRFGKTKDRIKVILVGESLGY